MARIRLVGHRVARRTKVEKQLCIVEQDVQEDTVVDEVDPNFELVVKLQKGLKLFREIAGDSDSVCNNCMFCIRFARCGYMSVL